MNKLAKLGIGGRVSKWIKSFLTNRKQIVLVNGTKSEAENVTSGVPQGSILGPLLFLLMIGDIDDNIRYSHLSSFADDTRLLKAIHEPLDPLKMQNDLNIVYKWTLNNNMKLNSSTFEHLKYGKNLELKNCSIYLVLPKLKIQTLLKI